MLDEVSKNDINVISDDGFQLEKELDNWVSKDFRNMLSLYQPQWSQPHPS